MKYKSRLVARADQEKTLGIRTDSPTADLDSINMKLSWAASEKLKLMSLDIISAYFHGERMTRLMILKPPRGGIPVEDFHPDRMYICRIPIYVSRDSGCLFWKRFKKESISAGLRASKLSSALFYVAHDGEPKVMMASHVDDLIYACKPGFEHHETSAKDFPSRRLNSIKWKFLILWTRNIPRRRLLNQSSMQRHN